jgi:hypothetical protein
MGRPRAFSHEVGMLNCLDLPLGSCDFNLAADLVEHFDQLLVGRRGLRTQCRLRNQSIPNRQVISSKSMSKGPRVMASFSHILSLDRRETQSG